ncbi:DNA alkylation repair protein [Flavobacteriaceae bacterium F08102]|nr:DNA alkylation repair protein [Flavobacteriaceae bacterium F08102]
MTFFLNTLETTFRSEANAQIAEGQKAYMRNQFEYLGLKTNDRRRLQKPFLEKTFLPDKKELEKFIKALWSKPERDFQLFGQELAQRFSNDFEENDIDLLVYMITHKSWWDTVDYIAIHLLGAYFKKFPNQQQPLTDLWISSNNLWLQRSSLLFQLNYKEKLNTVLLASIINSLIGSTEYFINKAIGWVLRQYSRTNPTWVTHFVKQTNLANLSQREALRLLK